MNEINFHKLFEDAPGLNLILSPDLNIVAVSNAYLSATFTTREAITGKYLFDAFPNDTDESTIIAVNNFRHSLNTVLETGKEDRMQVHRYDICKPDGIFEIRYWRPLNKPVFNDKKEIIYIIHNVQDVTDFVQTENISIELDKKNKALSFQNQENEGIIENEKRLRNSLDKMLEGVQIIGFDWKYLYVNDAFTKHAKYSKEELLGYTVLEKYPGIEHTETYELYLRCFNNRESIYVENEFKFPDGSIGWFELSFQPVPEGIVIRSVDITEKKKLLDQQALDALIVNSTNDAIISIDLNSVITSWNHGAEILFGYHTAEIIGKNISILIPSNTQKEEDEILRQIKNDESVERYETERIRKDGSVIYVSTTISPIKNLTGDIIGASRIVQDITKRKKAEEEIFKLNKQLIKSEIRFRGLIENSSDIVTLIDENYNALYRSPSTSRITGFTDLDRSKRVAAQQIHPDDIETYKAAVKESLSVPGKPLPLQIRTLHKDGHYIWLEGTIMNMLHDESVKGIISNYHDVTKRKEAEDEIIKFNKELEQKVIKRTAQLEALNKELQLNILQVRESEEKFSKIFESSPVGISIGSLKTGKILNANKSFLQLSGFTLEEIVGHSSLDLKIINTEDRQEIKKELLGKKQVRDKEIFVFNKSGRRFPVLLSLDQFSIGNDSYGITIAYDISERKKAEEELLKANKELEAFTYSVSHDLRAPLRAVNGYARILEEDYIKSFDAEGVRLLGEVQGNAKKMGILIDDLLAFSRLGRKEIKRSFIDMNELVQTAIKDIEPTFITKANIKPGVLVPVMGDYSLILQVMINLISNAVKYSSKKEEALVEINSTVNDTEITYSIRDNGVGFDMAYAHQLFGVFQRLHSADEFPGTGVGLAIVQRIINKHNGKIWAESEINKGATFYFSLPV